MTSLAQLPTHSAGLVWRGVSSRHSATSDQMRWPYSFGPLSESKFADRKGEGMAGYMVAQLLKVNDPEGWREYSAGVAATVAQYGGRFLVRGGEIQALEGAWGARMVIIEFESVERAREWYESEEYRPLSELRQRAGETMLSIVNGV